MYKFKRMRQESFCIETKRQKMGRDKETQGEEKREGRREPKTLSYGKASYRILSQNATQINTSVYMYTWVCVYIFIYIATEGKRDR